MNRAPGAVMSYDPGESNLSAVNAANAYSAELPLVQEPLSWPGFVIIGLAALILSVLAIIAPRRRGRMMMVTDVLRG
jgi:hypothetical protein